MKIQNKGDKFQNWLQIGQGAFVVACGCVCVCWQIGANFGSALISSCTCVGRCTACEEGGLCLCVCGTCPLLATLPGKSWPRIINILS